MRRGHDSWSCIRFNGRTDRRRRYLVMASGCAMNPERYYCRECHCPVNEHDEHGICRAIDYPPLGIEKNCKCPGLVVHP
jgi:hypothetical protein